MNLAALGLVFTLTLYLQRVQGRSPLEAGFAVLPLFLPMFILAPLAGRVTARCGPKGPMAIGLLIASAGVSLLLLTGAGSSYQTLLPALLLWGIGLGILTPAVVAAAIGAVPAESAGMASAVNNTARQAGAPLASPPSARWSVIPEVQISSLASTPRRSLPSDCWWPRQLPLSP
jgi:DHA2 family methylenomycin A resistance protein-like MFS transporter